MTATERDPWWASGADPQDAVAEGEPHDDPVEAHRAARRGEGGEHEGGRPGPGRDHAEPGTPPHDVDVCGVCPICVGLRVLGETRPELVAHLTEAARHLTAAARTVFEDVVRASDDAAPEDPDEDRVTRIDLD